MNAIKDSKQTTKVLNKMIVKEDIVIDSAVCEEELVSENIY